MDRTQSDHLTRDYVTTCPLYRPGGDRTTQLLHSSAVYFPDAVALCYYETEIDFWKDDIELVCNGGKLSAISRWRNQECGRLFSSTPGSGRLRSVTGAQWSAIRWSADGGQARNYQWPVTAAALIAGRRSAVRGLWSVVRGPRSTTTAPVSAVDTGRNWVARLQAVSMAPAENRH